MSFAHMTTDDAAEILGVTEEEVVALLSMQLLVEAPHSPGDPGYIDANSVFDLNQLRYNNQSRKAWEKKQVAP